MPVPQSASVRQPACWHQFRLQAPVPLTQTQILFGPQSESVAHSSEAQVSYVAPGATKWQQAAF